MTLAQILGATCIVAGLLLAAFAVRRRSLIPPSKWLARGLLGGRNEDAFHPTTLLIEACFAVILGVCVIIWL